MKNLQAFVISDLLLPTGNEFSNKWNKVSFLTNTNGRKLYWSGNRPNIFDMRVWSAIISAECAGSTVTINKTDVSKLIGIVRAGGIFERIGSSFFILCNSKIKIEDKDNSVLYEGCILGNNAKYDTTKSDSSAKIKIFREKLLSSILSDEDDIWKLIPMNLGNAIKDSHSSLDKMVRMWIMSNNKRETLNISTNKLYNFFTRRKPTDRKKFFSYVYGSVFTDLIEEGKISSYSVHKSSISIKIKH